KPLGGIALHHCQLYGWAGPRFLVDIHICRGYDFRIMPGAAGLWNVSCGISKGFKLVIGAKTNMKKIWLFSLVILAVTLTVVQPVLAATMWNLNVHNNTEEDVKVILTGPKNYSFDTFPGKIIKAVEEGTYKYNYGACGQKFSGEIEVKDNLQWLVIDPCPPTPIYTKFVVDSHLGTALTVNLVGPASYDLAVELGSNKFISIQAGFYSYSYTACGGTYGGQVQVEKNGTSRITLYGCEVVDYKLALTTLDSHSPTNLRIGSHYSFPVRLTLQGITGYSLVILPGLNRFNLFPGAYSYSFTAYGVFKTGSFIIGEGSAAFIISPLR
ncbi:MAG TPA: hypothetical protein VI688_06960, partial [Anaerolineales bacterium]|nr:hypothetical protein [Anaerolineales bacterium]